MRKTKSLLFISSIALFTISACNNSSPEKTTTTKIIEPTSSGTSTAKLPLNEETPVYAYSFPGLGKSVMPISAWCAPWSVEGKDYINLEQYQRIKESGLNSIYGLYERINVSDPDVFRALDLADQVGISYIVRDESLNALAEDVDDFKEHMDEFTKHKSFAGVFVKDEPNKAQFNGYVKARKLFRQYYTKYAYYINLFPNYASGTALSGTSESIAYDEYLDSFLKTITPQMLSYDYYGLDKNSPLIAGTYYEQIYKAKVFADRYRIPFWPFIQACKYANNIRYPSETDIYWQVGSNLVFGAKAIQYFCYQCPYEAPTWTGNFIDYNGNKTELFPYFQKINGFVSSIDEILMNSTLVDIMQYGNTPAKLPEELITVKESREIESVDTESDLLIGVFNYNRKTVAFVLNNNLTTGATATINFKTNVDANIYELNSMAFEENTKEISLSLKPGTSALVELTNY